MQQLEDSLPPGPFDAVVSAFAIHHLDADGKAALFGRVASVIDPAGRFVLADVVVPTRPVDQPVPLEPGVDRPNRVRDQLDWLVAAGLRPEVIVQEGDLAMIRAVADRSSSSRGSPGAGSGCASAGPCSGSRAGDEGAPRRSGRR